MKILDAGAGSGILSIALVERLQTFSHIQSIELTCYENDPHIVDLLKDNLMWVQNNSNIIFSYTVRTENYILSQDLEYNEKLGANPSLEIIESMGKQLIRERDYSEISCDKILRSYL